MGTFSVGGLASGLDTKSIVDQLMQIEGRTKTKLEWKQQLWTARKTAWSDLNSRLNTLQTAANALINPATWDVNALPSGSGPWTATSGDPSRLSATVTGAAPTAATYSIDILQRAQAQVSRSTGALAPASSGVRTTGIFYEGNNNPFDGTENLVAMRTQAGAGVGLNTNSRITMNYTVNGVAQSAEFRINTLANGGNGTTWADFEGWIEATIGNGATVDRIGGALRVTTAPGTVNELDAMSFTAVNAAGTNLPNFNALAAASTTQTTAAFDGGLTAADTLTISGGAGTWNVAVAIGDSKQDIVDKINATSGIGVLASINGGEIELRGTTMGAANAFSVTSTGSTAAQLGFTTTQAAQDAQFTVDGTMHTSATNSNVAGVIADVSLNLLGTTSTTLTIGQGSASGQSPEDQWIASVKKKVQDFVTAYNDSLSYVHQRTQGENKVVNPKNLGEYLQGPMARDVGFSSVAFDLRKLTGESVVGLPAGASMLSQVGIDTMFAIGGGGTNGHLKIDDAKLDAALRADPQSVQDVLGKVGSSAGIDSEDGIVRRISDQVSLLRVGGRVDTSMNGAGNQIKNIQDAIDRATDRLDRRKLYYERMFSSLESTLGRMQSQGSWLSGQLAALAGGNQQQ